MKFKTVLLTLVLIAGFTFQNCGVDDDCNCPTVLEFFDIQDMTMSTFKKVGSNNYSTTTINVGESIDFANYHSMRVEFQVDYLAIQAPCSKSNGWNFSLMNSAYACSCIENGFQGSKDEKLESISVITLNDFDDNYKANAVINDLFDIEVLYETSDLNEFLAQDTSIIAEEYFSLFLKKAPETDEIFQVKVVVEISDGEKYEVESTPVQFNL